MSNIRTDPPDSDAYRLAYANGWIAGVRDPARMEPGQQAPDPPDEDLARLGRIVHRRRHQLGLTQFELAEATVRRDGWPPPAATAGRVQNPAYRLA